MGLNNFPKLSPKQKFSVLDSTARINIWHGAVRSGKTIASLLRFAQWLAETDPKASGVVLLMGYSIDTIMSNVIMPLEEWLGKDIHYNQDLSKVIIFGHKIRCVGSSSEKARGAVKGITCKCIYIDELTEVPKVVLDMLFTRNSSKDAIVFATTNPDSPYHDVYKRFIKNPKDYIHLYHFKLEDNIFLEDWYVQQLKDLYTGMFYQRYILGEWTSMEGCIYPFDESSMTAELYLLPKPYTKVVSIDFGMNNPTSFGLYGITSTYPKIFRERGYYYQANQQLGLGNKTVAMLTDDLFEFIKNEPVSEIYIDPSALPMKEEIRRRLITTKRWIRLIDADNTVLDGIQTQQNMLENGSYVIAKHPTNEQCIKDYSLYVWDNKKQRIGEDRPIKEDDHTKDEERYVLHTKYGALQKKNKNRTMNYDQLTEEY